MVNQAAVSLSIFMGPNKSISLLVLNEIFELLVLRRRSILGCIFLVTSIHLQAQNPQKKDTVIILLSDVRIQLECNQALNDLYNFKFDRAEAKFRDLKTEYGWHPLPYFLM